MNIGPYSYEEYVHLVRAFHGRLDPGLIVGGFMIDLALKNLPQGESFGAVCETPSCLPDAVQLLTSCTAGNGRLRVLELGRFAATLYETDTGRGVRVFLDPSRLGPWTAISDWFLKRRRIQEMEVLTLIFEMRQAAHRPLGIGFVRVDPERLKHPRIGPVALCPGCGEAYPVEDGDTCLACKALDELFPLADLHCCCAKV